MAEYVQINILDMLESLGEDECSKILSSFVCPLNSDVENFARNKAIQFAKQRIAITYLVFVHQENDAYLAGYYTIANKFISVLGSVLSKTIQKKIGKFSQYDEDLQRYMISMPLIAQLGKNFAEYLPINVSGNDLLGMALERVRYVEHLIGGKTVYIECNNQPKLYDFYAANGFISFNQRLKDVGENSDKSDVLVQMLKYFNH